MASTRFDSVQLELSHPKEEWHLDNGSFVKQSNFSVRLTLRDSSKEYSMISVNMTSLQDESKVLIKSGLNDEATDDVKRYEEATPIWHSARSHFPCAN